MTSSDGPLEPQVLKKVLDRTLFSTNIIYHQTLNSTNRLLKELGASGAPEGTLVLAEEQTEGRGRRGRTWFSPPNRNLLFSVLLRPVLSADQVFSLTMALALAAIDGIDAISGLRPRIKWPNDLLVEDKKLAGILTEFSVKNKNIEYVALGLGLNVHWCPEDRGDDDRTGYRTTSILAETGRKVSRSGLLVGTLKCFETSYFGLLKGDVDTTYKRWNRASAIIGKEVEITSDTGRICGRALGINRRGTLIIQDVQGREKKILNGDVSLRPL